MGGWVGVCICVGGWVCGCGIFCLSVEIGLLPVDPGPLQPVAIRPVASVAWISDYVHCPVLVVAWFSDYVHCPMLVESNNTGYVTSEEFKGRKSFLLSLSWHFIDLLPFNKCAVICTPKFVSLI